MGKVQVPSVGCAMNDSIMAQIAMVAMSAGMTFPRARRKYYDCLEGVDIIEEYTLVKMKKSQLSFSQREAVVYRYEHAKSRTDTE
jgi:hypothetical protein